MEPLIFKRTFNELKWRKPVYIWMSFAFGPAFVLGIYTLFTDRWQPGLLLIIFIPIFVSFIYKTLQRMEARVNRWKTFKITIDNYSIHRDFQNEPTQIIERSAIKAIVKTRSGGVRVNAYADNSIWIPDDIQDYDQIIKIIEGDLKSNFIKPSDSSESVNKNSNVMDVIVNEKPPESFLSFLKLLQDHFVGISIFTTLIILVSYIKIYFYYGLYDINVNSYIDVSEIILAFGSIIKELIALAIFYIGIYRLFEFVKMKNGKPTTTITKYLSIFQVVVIIGGWIIFYRSIPEFLVTKLILETVTFTINVLIPQFVILAFTFAGTILLISFLYIYAMGITASDRLVTMTSTTLALVISFLLIIMLESKTSYSLNKAGYPKYSVTLLLNNLEQIESNDSLVFIGGTVNYYFFHDFKKNQNTIVPKSSVLKERQSQLRIGL